jgi:hypothetical protein
VRPYDRFWLIVAFHGGYDVCHWPLSYERVVVVVALVVGSTAAAYAELVVNGDEEELGGTHSAVGAVDEGCTGAWVVVVGTAMGAATGTLCMTVTVTVGADANPD